MRRFQLGFLLFACLAGLTGTTKNCRAAEPKDPKRPNILWILASAADEPKGAGRYGPLLSDPKGVFDLPKGFSYQIIARRGDEMADGLLVPGQPDGMASFKGPDGLTLVVCNHELAPSARGAGPFGPKLERLDKIDRKENLRSRRGKDAERGGKPPRSFLIPSARKSSVST